MFRRYLAGAGERGFEWRGGEITRLEAFSDAVFAFAVTLLVVSLEVPHTYHELINVMKGFPAFAICFAMLAQVWYEHAKYFRRYGLQDTYTVFLNSVLLFVVLFYVYPLKFLFTFLIGMITRGASLPEHVAPLMETAHDARGIMVIYRLGFAAVFLVFFLLYLSAYRRRAEMNLNAVETLRTKKAIVDHLAMVAIGITSTLVAVLIPERLVGIAGYVYFTIGIYHWIAGTKFGAMERRVAANTLATKGAAH